jgi:hypothetical protein
MDDDDELDSELARRPEYHMGDDEVESMEIDYSTRGPGDWVLSGPLGQHGGGPGRRFVSIQQAEAHARALHGDRVKCRITEATLFGANRWAYLIAAKKES